MTSQSTISLRDRGHGFCFLVFLRKTQIRMRVCARRLCFSLLESIRLPSEITMMQHFSWHKRMRTTALEYLKKKKKKDKNLGHEIWVNDFRRWNWSHQQKTARRFVFLLANVNLKFTINFAKGTLNFFPGDSSSFAHVLQDCKFVFKYHQRYDIIVLSYFTLAKSRFYNFQ